MTKATLKQLIMQEAEFLCELIDIQEAEIPEIKSDADHDGVSILMEVRRLKENERT